VAVDIHEGLPHTDPIDMRIGGDKPVGRSGRPWAAPRRLALGLSPTPRAGLLLLPLGMAFGPRGLGVLSDGALAALDPAVSVAVAALGVFIGLDLTLRRLADARMLLAASLQAAITIIAVVGGVLIVDRLSPADETTPWLLALMLGICASASSTAATQPESPVSRIGDLGDVLPILVGALALASMHRDSEREILRLTAETGVTALAVAAAAWLLVTQTSSESEQRVFTIGALLLLGGAAAYLSTSGLFAGLVAGACWSLTSVEARDRIGRDIRYLQHLLIVLLLLVAGARLEFSPDLYGMAAVYLVCRAAGKLVGGWLAIRVGGDGVPHDAALSLLGPGIAGVAFALNALQIEDAAPAVATVFTVVVAGSIGSEVLSLLARDADR
jgi:hypothetical protein